MENYELVYFLTIAEEGSLTKAAQKLFVSQPALSQYLRKLEKNLKLKLYDRQKNNALVLTPAGVRYYRYCEEALRLWEDAYKEMQTQDQQAAIVLGLASPRMTRIMEDYCRSRPDASQFLIRRILATALPEKLLTGEIMIAMGGYMGEHPMLRYRCLLCRELDLLVPYDHPLASRSFLIKGNENVRIRLEEATQLPFVLLESHMLWRQCIDHYCKKQGLHLSVAEQTNTTASMWQRAAEQHMATFQMRDFDSGLTPAGMMPVALDPPIFYTSGVFHRKDLEITPLMMQIIERYCAFVFE